MASSWFILACCVHERNFLLVLEVSLTLVPCVHVKVSSWRCTFVSSRSFFFSAKVSMPGFLLDMYRATFVVYDFRFRELC